MRDPQHGLAGHPRSPLSFEGLPAALDNKEDPTCSRTPRLLGRLYDGDEHASWFEERPGTPPDLPAHQVEDNVYLARHLLEAPAFSIYKLLSPEPAYEIFRPRSPRRYHVGARPPGQLNGKDADAASRAVDQHALARRETSMHEQRLPGRQGGQRYGGSPLMVQRARLRGEVARFDGDVARGRAVAVPVGQSVYLISYRKTGGTVAQSGYDARNLVGRDRRSTRLARAVHPGGRPLKLRGGKTRGAHFEQYVPDSGRGWEDALVVDKALRAAPRLRTQRLHRPSSLGGGFVHHAFFFHMSLASSTIRAKVVSTPPVVSRKGQTIFTCSVLSMVLVPMTFSPLPDKPRVSQADRSNRGGALGGGALGAIARR